MKKKKNVSQNSKNKCFSENSKNKYKSLRVPYEY